MRLQRSSQTTSLSHRGLRQQRHLPLQLAGGNPEAVRNRRQRAHRSAVMAARIGTGWMLTQQGSHIGQQASKCNVAAESLLSQRRVVDTTQRPRPRPASLSWDFADVGGVLSHACLDTAAPGQQVPWPAARKAAERLAFEYRGDQMISQYMEPLEILIHLSASATAACLGGCALCIRLGFRRKCSGLG